MQEGRCPICGEPLPPLRGAQLHRVVILRAVAEPSSIGRWRVCCDWRCDHVSVVTLSFRRFQRIDPSGVIRCAVTDYAPLRHLGCSWS